MIRQLMLSTIYLGRSTGHDADKVIQGKSKISMANHRIRIQALIGPYMYAGAVRGTARHLNDKTPLQR